MLIYEQQASTSKYFNSFVCACSAGNNATMANSPEVSSNLTEFEKNCFSALDDFFSSVVSGASDADKESTSDELAANQRSSPRPHNLELSAGNNGNNANEASKSKVDQEPSEPRTLEKQPMEHNDEILSAFSKVNPHSSACVPVDSSKTRTAPVERMTHSGFHDPNQSPSRRSPRSPPSSPSWMRYHRESPTRSPVVRNRSPQISPSEKHPMKFFDGSPGSSFSAQEIFADDGLMERREINLSSTLNQAMDQTGSIRQELRTDLPSVDDYSLDLASFAATVASGTAHLMGMNISPPDSDFELFSKNVLESSEQLLSRNYFDGYADPSRTEPVEETQASKAAKLIPHETTDWSPIRDLLYPILDVSPSVEKMEQEKMFSENEQRMLDEEEDRENLTWTEPHSSETSPQNTKLAGLKRCPSFSNIPSLTGLAEPKAEPASVSVLPIEDRFAQDDVTSSKRDMHMPTAALVVPRTIESKRLDCNLIDIDDCLDLYSGGSSLDVTPEGYDTMRHNYGMQDHLLLAPDQDDQHLFLSSDEDREIDLDEDIPPKPISRKSKEAKEQQQQQQQQQQDRNSNNNNNNMNSSSNNNNNNRSNDNNNNNRNSNDNYNNNNNNNRSNNDNNRNSNDNNRNSNDNNNKNNNDNNNNRNNRSNNDNNRNSNDNNNRNSNDNNNNRNSNDNNNSWLNNNNWRSSISNNNWNNNNTTSNNLNNNSWKSNNRN